MRRQRLNRVLQWLAWTAGAVFLSMSWAAVAAQKADVPVVDGHLGSCSANFTVTDAAHKPIFNAKIDVVVHYGFLGLPRMSLQVGTDSDGKARVAGLPEKIKQPLEFIVSSGGLSETVVAKPPMKCDSRFEVTLGKK